MTPWSGRDGHRPAHLREQVRRRDARHGGGVRELAASLNAVGVTGFGRRIVWFALLALLAGLAQAGLLVIVTELAVDATQGHAKLQFHGHALGLWTAIEAGFLLLAVYFVASVGAAFISSAVASGALRSSQRELVRGFFRAEWSVQSEERIGHLQQLLGVNCNQVSNLVVGLARGLQSFLMVAGLLGVAFAVNPLVAAAVMVVGVLLSFVMRPLNKLSRSLSRRFSAASEATATKATEYSRLAREFRLFGVERRARAELGDTIDATALLYRHTQRLALTYNVVYQSVALAFVVGAVAFVGGHKAGSLATFGAVLLLILRSFTYTSTLQGLTQSVRGSQGFLEELVNNVTRYDSRRSETRSGNHWPGRFDVNFRGVSYSYDGVAKALADVTFQVPEGAVVGILGRSGSGKTTLSQLVLGMRSPTRGRVLVGDVSASRLPVRDGRSPVALVPQEPILLQGSIAYNIAFFRDVSGREIEEAARAAHLHDEIVRMRDGYGTLVGEGGGSAISGGQRQRLAIARALIGKPQVMVLDEPTSALDARSEALVRETLDGLKGEVTIFVISHRLATVENCDYLLVLEDGRLADFGPRADVAGGKAYRHVTEPHLFVAQG